MSELEELTKKLLHQSPAGLALLDLQGTVIAHNSVLSRWIGTATIEPGRAASALVGRNIGELLAPSDRLLYETQVLPTLRAGKRVREMMIETLDFSGNHRSVLFNAELIDSDAKQPLIALAVIEASERASIERQLIGERNRADVASARLAVLQEATSQLAVANGIDDLGKIVVSAAARATNAAFTTLELLPTSQAEVTIPARRWGNDPVTWQQPGQAENLEVIVCRNPQELRNTFPGEAPEVLRQGVKSLCVVPLVTTVGKALQRFGEIRCWFHQPRALDSDITGTLEALAAQVDLLLDHLSLRERLQHEARHDVLTGLPNRAALHERLVRLLSYSGRIQAPCGALFLDLDGFKAINDQLGHAEGDTVLQEISERLQSVSRLEDSVARLGGDEFVIAGMMDREDAEELARRIGAVIREPLHGKASGFPVSASIGIVTWNPHDNPLGPDATQLVDLADLAMYEAKRAGRDRSKWRSWGLKTSVKLAEKIGEHGSE